MRVILVPGLILWTLLILGCRRGPDERLLDAAASGSADDASRALAEGAKPDSKDSQGQAALHLAITNGHYEIAHSLLSIGADPKARTQSGATPLLQAAERGRVGLVESLLEKGAELNATDSTGMTPLMAAAGAGQQELVKLLRLQGADSVQRDRGDRNAAGHARRAGHAGLADSLETEFEDGVWKGKTSQGRAISFWVKNRKPTGPLVMEFVPGSEQLAPGVFSISYGATLRMDIPDATASSHFFQAAFEDGKWSMDARGIVISKRLAVGTFSRRDAAGKETLSLRWEAQHSP